MVQIGSSPACPEISLWIFLERRPSSNAPDLIIHWIESALLKLLLLSPKPGAVHFFLPRTQESAQSTGWSPTVSYACQRYSHSRPSRLRFQDVLRLQLRLSLGSEIGCGTNMPKDPIGSQLRPLLGSSENAMPFFPACCSALQ